MGAERRNAVVCAHQVRLQDRVEAQSVEQRPQPRGLDVRVEIRSQTASLDVADEDPPDECPSTGGGIARQVVECRVSPGSRHELKEDGDLGASGVVEGQELFEQARHTTLSLDDDVLMAVKDRAWRERRSVGAVLSELARQALTARQPEQPGEEFHGFRPLPPRGGPVSNATIDLLRENEPV